MYPSPRRGTGLVLMLLVHLAILLFWRMAYAPLPAARDSAVRWIDLLPAIERTKPPSAPTAPAARPAPRPPAAASAPAPVELPPPVEPPAVPAAPDPAPPPGLTSEELMRLARREFSAVAREAERERRGFVTTPQLTPQQKLERGIASAETAPMFWQAPRITDVSDPNGYDRRIYKVEFKGIKYCIYVESNHAHDGIDQMRNGIKPKIANCPRE